jgi:hypothetical protein
VAIGPLTQSARKLSKEEKKKSKEKEKEGRRGH